MSEFRGSKYVQSNIGDSYIITKNFLELGRLVLFSGSPCQISGLKRYLRKDYDNLITIDFVCHGVPNNKLFLSYIKFLENKNHSKITSFCFRDKTIGWQQFAVKALFNNGKVYCQPQTIDKWRLAFNRDIMLRQSCYNCLYKTKDRESDITIADLWGINEVVPELNDNKGTSLLLIQNDKAQKLFEAVNSQAIYKFIDFERIKKFNSFHQTKIHEKRDVFIEICLSLGFGKAYNKYVESNLLVRLYNFCRRMLGKGKRILLKIFRIEKKAFTQSIVDELLTNNTNIK